MSKMYDMILVNQSVKALILDAIGDCFGGDDFKYVHKAMSNNAELYTAMVDDCIDHYYDMAGSEYCDEACTAADRYIIDLYIRAYLFENYNAQLLSKIPVTPPAANENNKSAEKTNEGNDQDGKSNEGNTSQNEKDQNLRDLGMTDEEIKIWKSHGCHECKKHQNFNDRLECMRRNIKAAEAIEEITKDMDDVFVKVFGFRPDDDFENFVKHILGI